MRRGVDLRSTPNLNPADVWTPTEGLTIANADDPAVQLNDLYPALSASLPEKRNARLTSSLEEHPLRVSSVDSVRFTASLPKKLVERIERIFPAVRIYPLSYRECEGLTSPGIEFSTDTIPSTFFPGANEHTLLSRILAGGLPAMQGLTSEERDRRWQVYTEELIPLLGRGDRRLGESAVALLRILASRPSDPVDCKDLSHTLSISLRQTKCDLRRCVELSLIEPVYPVDATAFSEPLPFFFRHGISHLSHGTPQRNGTEGTPRLHRRLRALHHKRNPQEPRLRPRRRPHGIRVRSGQLTRRRLRRPFSVPSLLPSR